MSRLVTDKKPERRSAQHHHRLTARVRQRVEDPLPFRPNERVGFYFLSEISLLRSGFTFPALWPTIASFCLPIAETIAPGLTRPQPVDSFKSFALTVNTIWTLQMSTRFQKGLGSPVWGMMKLSNWFQPTSAVSCHERSLMPFPTLSPAKHY